MLPSKDDFYNELCLEITFYCEMLIPENKSQYLIKDDNEFIGIEVDNNSKYGITVLFESYVAPLEVLTMDTLYDLYEILKDKYETN